MCYYPTVDRHSGLEYYRESVSMLFTMNAGVFAEEAASLEEAVTTKAEAEPGPAEESAEAAAETAGEAPVEAVAEEAAPENAAPAVDKLIKAEDLEGFYQSSSTGVKKLKNTEYTSNGNSITAVEGSKYYTGTLKF